MRYVKAATRTGKSSHALAVGEKRTVCGVRVKPVENGKPFDRDHELACVRCIEFLDKR